MTNVKTNNCKATDNIDAMYIAAAEEVKQLLISCMSDPGANITISVEHDNGSKATAELYDLAAFVPGLIKALEDFQHDLA